MSGTWTVTRTAVAPIHTIIAPDFAEAALMQSSSALEFKRWILERFPDYSSDKALDHQRRFLFP